jgi:hypothetical protein
MMPTDDDRFSVIGAVRENVLDEILEVLVLDVVLDLHADGLGQRF